MPPKNRGMCPTKSGMWARDFLHDLMGSGNPHIPFIMPIDGVEATKSYGYKNLPSLPILFITYPSPFSNGKSSSSAFFCLVVIPLLGFVITFLAAAAGALLILLAVPVFPEAMDC